ncbi:KpsF/GutQ family sugar-phosphate isomerase [Rhodobium gokarnense]|uniref:Arabinose-5-phosphate isomerase n=1 Tax=Rhodobium gokarnense TaxID=364296 RepID=A0ABT3H6Q4_9HYPH|nr:KpsF/GutQ family sugar-phosphate isomerase [Rhodobium gokarnense]MCW2306070.1 arabinose-5-phosphate isomerase [Rhodobium gokarnense]
MAKLAIVGGGPLSVIDHSDVELIESAGRTVHNEIQGLMALQKALGNGLSEPFVDAVRLISGIPGRVIVTGIGKSGHIGSKIAATFASTGTPAFFVHPSEASHGDLGMVTAGDAIIAISWSGETREMASIIAYSRRFRVPLIALTSSAKSTLGRAADIVLALPKAAEACPHGLAPTTSTILQLSVGDAMAIALLEARGFTPQDFGIFHPGGRLGASLQFVRDIMHTGDRVPLTPLDTPMTEAIVLITQKGFGSLGIVDEAGRLAGIITDGDLRRHLASDLLSKRVDEVMTRSPKTVKPDLLVASALEMLESSSISALFVVEDERAVGIIHLHDLLRAGVA